MVDDTNDMMFNMGDVKDISFKPIPEDTYKLRVKEAKILVAKSTGKPYLNLLLQVVEGKYEGRTLFDVLAMSTEKAQEITKAKLMALIPDLDPNASMRLSEIVEAITNSEFTTKVKIDDGNDEYEPKNRAGFYKAVS